MTIHKFENINEDGRHSALMQRAELFSIGSLILDYAKSFNADELQKMMMKYASSAGLNEKKELFEKLRIYASYGASEKFWKQEAAVFLNRINEDSLKYLENIWIEKSINSRPKETFHAMMDRKALERSLLQFNCCMFMISSYAWTARLSSPSRNFIMKSLGFGFFERLSNERFYR